MQNNLEDYEKINLKSTENFELYGDALPFALKYYIKELLLTNNNSHSAILIMDDFQYQSKKAMISTFENQGFNQLVIVIDNNHLSVYNFGGKKNRRI